MPRKKEYETLLSRQPDAYPARYHTALLRLMSGELFVPLGSTDFGSLEQQRIEWCRFLRSWPEGGFTRRFIAEYRIRTFRTTERSGMTLWAKCERRPVTEIAEALK